MTGFEDTRAWAEAGDAAAQFNLGFMYGTGRGVWRDDREAVRLYRLVGDQGYADAQRATRGPQHLRGSHQSTERSNHSTISGAISASIVNPRCVTPEINSTCACGANASNTTENSSA